LRMAKFHGFEGPKGLLKMKRIVDIARSSNGIHKFLDGLTSYLEEIGESPEKVDFYKRCTSDPEFKREEGRHSLNFMVSEGLKREREKKIPSSLPSDMVNLFFNSKITGLQSPACSIIPTLGPEIKSALSKSLKDAHLNEEDGIHRTITMVALRHSLPKEAQIECFGMPLKKHA